MSLVLPVIHHLNVDLSREQADMAFECGADGVFLISHTGADLELLDVLTPYKKDHSERWVGVNFLGEPKATSSYNIAETAGADGVWMDYAGVNSQNIGLGLAVRDAKRARAGRAQIFASVAFKYQAPEPNPALAALKALDLDFIPTTSGPATGCAPDLEKIKAMSRATKGVLAVASGMTCENVAAFVPHVSHILVATGVSLDMHRFDYEKLTRFVSIVRNETTAEFVGNMCRVSA